MPHFPRLLAAVATAFKGNGAIDHDRLAQHCRWLLAEGCEGLVLFGTTGEAPSITVSERKAALEAVLAAGLPASALLVGTGCCAIADTAALTRHALELGCAGALVVPPFYFKGVSLAGIVDVYARLTQEVRSDRPWLYLYHFPKLSGVPLTPDVVKAIQQKCGAALAGYKDSSGEWENTRSLISSFPELGIYLGNETRVLESLALGGAGCISATANIQPRRIREAIDSAEHKSEAAMVMRQFRQAVEQFPSIAAVKAVLAKMTGEDEWENLRSPLTSLSQEDQQQLFQQLEKLSAQ